MTEKEKLKEKKNLLLAIILSILATIAYFCRHEGIAGLCYFLGLYFLLASTSKTTRKKRVT